MLKPSGGVFKKMFSPEKLAQTAKKKEPMQAKPKGPFGKAISKGAY